MKSNHTAPRLSVKNNTRFLRTYLSQLFLQRVLLQFCAFILLFYSLSCLFRFIFCYRVLLSLLVNVATFATYFAFLILLLLLLLLYLSLLFYRFLGSLLLISVLLQLYFCHWSFVSTDYDAAVTVRVDSGAFLVTFFALVFPWCCCAFWRSSLHRFFSGVCGSLCASNRSGL